MLKEWVHDSHLTLVKNPHWPGTESVPQPTVEEITWTIIDDADDLMAMYEAGDLVEGLCPTCGAEVNVATDGDYLETEFGDVCGACVREAEE